MSEILESPDRPNQRRERQATPVKVFKFRNRKKTIENGLKILNTLIPKVAIGITELRATLDIIIYGLPDRVGYTKSHSKRRFIEAYNEAFKDKREKTWMRIIEASLCLVSEFPIERTIVRKVVQSLSYLVNQEAFEKQAKFWFETLSPYPDTCKFAKQLNTKN